MGLVEIRQEIRELRRSIEHLILTSAQDADPRGGDDRPAESRELDTETEEAREQALARIEELIEAQQQATAQALRDVSQRQTAKDMDRYANEWISERDLKREKKLISQSQDVTYLRKMADAE